MSFPISSVTVLPSFARCIAGYGTAALLLVMSANAVAQTASKEPWEELGNRVKESENISALGNELFGEQVGLAQGDLSFSNTDVSVPGNNALPVAITRTFKLDDHRGYRNDHPFADWDIDLPSVSGVYATQWVAGANGSTNRCTATHQSSASPPASALFQPWEFWQGLTLNIPGKGSSELLLANSTVPLPATGGPYRWITSDLTIVACLPTINNSTGEGFIATTPDGTRYWFTWMAQTYEPQLKKKPEGSSTTYTLERRRNALYATRVEDRFGNYVLYTYTNASTAPIRVTRIAASDGRQLDLTYNANGHIGTVTDGLRTWTYEYGNVTITGGTYRTLTSVIQPDSRRWNLDLAQFSQTFIPRPPVEEGSWNCYTPPELPVIADKIGTITHPSGAQGRFQVGIVRHGSSNVPTTCRNDMLDAADQARITYVNARPIAWDALALKQKRISGPGIATAEWNYGYSSASSYVQQTNRPDNVAVCDPSSCPPPSCTNDTCAGWNTTTITGPTQKITYRHGNSYAYNEGKLLSITTTAANASTVLSSETRGYDLSLVNQGYPARFGTSPRYYAAGFSSEYLRPQFSTSITQETTVYNRTVNSFDALAREISVTRSNTAGIERTDVTAYHDSVDRWVLGQLVSSTNIDTGIVESRTDYDPVSLLPGSLYRNGLLSRSIGYNANGTISTVSDPLQRVTKLSNWKRGAPQRIEFADQSVETGVVDDRGWISSTTNARGHLTSYGYDPVGRLASITHPTGDTVNWANPGYTYVLLVAAENGLTPGHWRARRTLGNSQRSIYYDSLWRPVLTEEKDTITGQARYVRKTYDTEGRTIFESYPSTTNLANDGITSEYDALGRLIKRRTASGTLLETIDYLSQSRRKVTDADGRETTIRYQAFDAPSYERPIRIDAPENQTTSMQRDVFGKLLKATQSGPFGGTTLSYNRIYAYDSYQRLCGRNDPESGSTGWGYNEASELIWELKGQSATSCVTTIPSTATRFTYDLRGRKELDDYPGTASDVLYSYDAAGNLTSVGNPAATWTYTWNKRNLLEREQAVVDGRTYAIDPTYNSLAQVASVSYPSLGSVAYDPNVFGEPTRVGSYATSIEYHPNKQLASYTLGNGLRYTQSLDSRQRPALEEVRPLSGPSVQKLSYSYSDGDDLLTIGDLVDSSDSATMSYDGLHRLKTASGLWGDYGYDYDPINNITRRTGGAGTLTYAYDASKNRVTSISRSATTLRSYSYHATGRTLSDGARSYAWNALDQITAVTGTASYAYDGNGRRIKTVKATGEIEYALYTQAGALVYVDRPGAEKATVHLQLGGRPFVDITLDNGSPSSTLYLHADLLGSPRTATGSSGQNVYREHYAPYGEKLNNVDFRIGYTGHANDYDTGLVYAQARYYDPLVGRFLSIDPIGFRDDPFGFNRYSYANDNPYRFKDPNGKEVIGIYSNDSQSLFVVDRDSRHSAFVSAESGGKPFGAPIPPGGYAILERLGREGFYRLESYDEQFGDDATPDGRTNLRLHHPGRTVGCISICTDDGFQQIKSIFDRTGKTSSEVDSKSLIGRIFGGKENVVKFGSLGVLPSGASLNYNKESGEVSISFKTSESRIPKTQHVCTVKNGQCQ